MRRAGATIIALLTAAACAQCRAADDRSLLNHCKALLAQGSHSAASNNPDVQRCQLIIREWTLRDSRMSVDEEGRPLR
jgi:hypothetical protein